MVNRLITLLPNMLSQYRYYTQYSPNTSAWQVYLTMLVLGACIYLAIMLLVYLYEGFILMKLAEHIGLEDRKYYAWIPFLRIYLLALMAKKDLGWALLAILFRPVTLYLYYELVTKRFGKNTAYFLLFLVLLFIFPPGALYMSWKLAHEKPVA